jgi:Bacterial PH domain
MNLQAGSNEIVFWEAHPSQLMYIKYYALYGFGLLFCLSTISSFPIISIIGILFLSYKTFEKYWEVKQTHYLFTHERLRVVHGGFNRRTFDITLTNISDVELHESFIYQIFKLGTLEIKHTQWGVEHLFLNGIEDARNVRERISGFSRRSDNVKTYDYIDLAPLNNAESIKLLK